MSVARKAFDALRAIVRSSLHVEMVSGRATYNQDGLLSKHNSDFQRDPEFARAYAKGVETGSWGREQVQWRAYVVAWAARQGLQREGDFVECGVNKGGMASVILDYTQLWKTPRKFWLLDTFNGLADTHLTEQERRRVERHWKYEECYDYVSKRFAPYPNVILVRCEVPGTLPQVTTERIAYLGIDMNCTEPEIAAAMCFWDRMTTGSVMVLDDYGWSGHEDQKRAFDDFARERGVGILSLPTGQALLIKP